MSSLSCIRVNIFNENFLNESEQDANSVLTELDKGLRSAKIGVQCEAIVRFPRLFEKYPFPILINSSFLKLSEFFWNGSNLLRFWILRVCQQTENHLDKILNIDAFVKRIFMVIYSNDPIARALTLRTLGAVSRVIPEKQQVHHAIRRALESHDTVEVEAAIYASNQFAAQSKTFAISMCAKISDMIESLQIPVPMKLQLIPVLRHMHHDANTATMVKELCSDLLPKYPAEGFVVAILDTLTQLSSRTLTGVPDQVNLLLKFLEDPRKPVRAQCLHSLRILADAQCVNAWPKTAIAELIKISKECENSREQYLFLGILLKLSDCPLTCHVLLHEQQSDILDLCLNCLALEDYTTCGQAMSILAALVAYSSGEQQHIDGIMHMVNLHMEYLLFCTIRSEEYKQDLRKILSSGVRIASVNSEFGANFVAMVADLLSDDVDFPAINIEIMCEALGGLCSHFQLLKFKAKSNDPMAMEVDGVDVSVVKKNPVLDRLPLILRILNGLMKDKETIASSHLHTVELLAAVAFQSMIGCFIPTKAIECFENACTRSDSWTQYRIGRSASRYGQHYVAAHIFGKLSRHAVVDKFYFFLLGLTQMEQAECMLNYGIEYDFMRQNYAQYDEQRNKNIEDASKETIPMVQRLEKSINLYWQALASLRASSSPMQPLTFQLEFLKLRAQFLQTLQMAATVRNSQIVVPPPAIAGSLAQNSRDYLQKFGYITNQLRKLVKQLKSCGEAYSRLYKSAFDADPASLEFIEICEYQCALLANIVETVCYAAAPSEPPTYYAIGQCPETRYFASSCAEMSVLQEHLPQEPSNAKTINNRHLEVISAEVEVIINTPLCLPRYFYQTLQATQIKLSVSPQPRSPGEPVIVQSGSNLVIKVEGVIQHYGKKQALYRKIDTVQLCLISQLMMPTQKPLGEAGKPPLGNETVTLTQTIKPQRDFLSGSFLLPISSGGQWQVSLETYVIDENGTTWCTGPKNSMIVRVLDDNSKVSTPTPASQTRRF